jgi:type I restriction enzyme S subunit
MKSVSLHPSSLILQTFFQKFELFADVPDAVARMRDLVLELAVQGKLSEHRATDVNDPAWLKLIQQLDKESGAFVSDSEPPFEIPSWWRWTTLESLGNTKPRNNAPDSSKSSFVPMTLIPAKYGECVRHEERPWGEIKKGYTHFQNGDVVMAKITPCFENGKSVVMNELTSGFGAGTTELHVFRRTGESVLTEFVILYLKTRGFITRGIPRMTGSAGQKRIPNDYFARSPFPLPPLAEQKRIVAKVDELMALCDRLEEQQQERETRHAALVRASLARFADAPTPANLNFLFHPSYTISPADLRKSILTLAVQGKLVPQDPNDEPAEASFPKLATAAVESDADGFPAHWLRVPLGKIGEWRGGGTPSKSRPDFWTGDLPWVSPKDMKVLHISDAQDHISPVAVECSSVRLIPPGSLLMVVRGMILARAFPVALTMREVTINQDMKALLPSEPKTKDFLLTVLRAFEPLVLDAIERSSHGTCKLKTEFLQDVVIPIPPLAEQRRIVAKVEQLMALVDALETQLTASSVTSANLLSALVAELTGTPNNRHASISPATGSGRRGRPCKT